MTVVISAHDLGKAYLIRHKANERYTTLRDILSSKIRGLGRRSANGEKETIEEFWALRAVHFEICEGDRVGVIGRNGAGKSTLLKILSRITEPSAGHVTIRGRVASLLEVGTGFHPELTGRENIFLNGAILGMSRAEIVKKFDEIVRFAEVEKFLDTPVKRYSSGMYVRLAFAVAAHLQPEILVVDEVLAVGDAEFQKKCLGKMGEVSGSGRTVLFVSHNMAAIEQLCTSALLLHEGRIKRFDTDVHSVIREYLTGEGGGGTASVWCNRGREYANPWFMPTRFFIADENGRPLRMPVRNDADMWIQIEAEIEELDPALTVGYAVYTEQGTPLYWSYQTDDTQTCWPPLHRGRIALRSRLPKRFLNEGDYRLELVGGLHFRKWLFEPGKACPSILLQISGGLSDSPLWLTRRPVALAPVLRWELVA